jgi:hypothetical protein
MYPWIRAPLYCSMTDSSPDWARAGFAIAATATPALTIAVRRRMKLEVIQFLHSKDVNCGGHPLRGGAPRPAECSIALENSIEQTLRSK